MHILIGIRLHASQPTLFHSVPKGLVEISDVWELILIPRLIVKNENFTDGNYCAVIKA